MRSSPKASRNGRSGPAWHVSLRHPLRDSTRRGDLSRYLDGAGYATISLRKTAQKKEVKE